VYWNHQPNREMGKNCVLCSRLPLVHNLLTIMNGEKQDIEKFLSVEKGLSGI
jgi:hypothetical protein